MENLGNTPVKDLKWNDLSEEVRSEIDEVLSALEQDSEVAQDSVASDDEATDVQTPFKKLPLNAFLKENHAALLRAVSAQNPPVYFGQVNAVRSAALSQLKRRLFPAQENCVHAVSHLLFDENQPAAIINAEMGTGKTMMAIAVGVASHAAGYTRSLVLSPPHLVYKWRREILETVPNARVWILNGPNTLRQLLQCRAMLAAPKVPEFFILGRVRLRMGYHWQPSFNMASFNGSRAKYASCPDCGQRILLGDDKVGMSKFEAEEILAKKRLFCTAKKITKTALDKSVRTQKTCGSPLWSLVHKQGPQDRSSVIRAAIQKIPTIGPKTTERLISVFGEEFLASALDDNIHNFINLMDENGELFFNDRQATRMERMLAKTEFDFGNSAYQASEFIKRYLPQNYFGLLIVDEGHEYKNEGSAQGQAFGVLARKCQKTLLLTGTLMGGYADDLFYLLWRLNPALMMEEGFRYNQHNSLSSACSRFMSQHGVLKEITVINQDLSTSLKTARGNKSRVKIKKAPGFGPAGVMRCVLPMTTFLKLKQIDASVLPSYEEELLLVPMTDEQRLVYDCMSAVLKKALRNAIKVGDHSLMGLVLNALLAWPDCAFRPEKLIHPREKDFVLFESQPVFEMNEPSPKEEAVIALCRKEISEGRRVLLYTTYTQTRDTTSRLKHLLELRGIKTAVLKSTVKADLREDWIDDQIEKGVSVLICNPELVKTGLDLLGFPTIVFMQTGYNVYTLMQASRRSWRIGQKNAVKVIFTAFKESAQEDCLTLMGQKVTVCQSTSGDMPDSGLEVLNQSGDSIEVALAKRLLSQPTEQVPSVPALF